MTSSSSSSAGVQETASSEPDPQTTTAHLDVGSPDGVTIAVWVDGSGPPVVLVHGSPSDHTTFAPLVGALHDSMTTYAMDRRGSGASSDRADFAVEREFEDVAGVVDAVATRTGGPVALFGHSYGASCAMGGAALTSNVSHLILYEPSFGLTYPPGVIEKIETIVAHGDHEAALLVVLVDLLEMDNDDVTALRASPRWERLLAVTPTMPREARVEHTWVYEPDQFAGLTAPTMMLTGSDTVPALNETTTSALATLPGAHVHVLEGHGHFAFDTDPDTLASLIKKFVTS